MGNFRDGKVNEHLVRQGYDLIDQLRAFEIYNRTMSEYGCPEGTLGERIDWLDHELGELRLLREARDGNLTDVIGRFTEILKSEHPWFHSSDPTEVLSMALDRLRELFALQEHLRKNEIWVHHRTIYPEEGGSE